MVRKTPDCFPTINIEPNCAQNVMERMALFHVCQDVKSSQFTRLKTQIFKESRRILSRVKLIRSEKRKSGRTFARLMKYLTIPVDLFFRVIHQNGRRVGIWRKRRDQVTQSNGVSLGQGSRFIQTDHPVAIP